MRYANVLRRFGPAGSFELPTLLAFTGEKRATVLQTLYRWNQKGWIIPIRRGLYTFPDDLAKNPVSVERAANQIQPDSYVSGLWLMNHLGLIPGDITVVTNATPRNPAKFETRVGRFAYQHIQKQGFFGYEERLDAGGISVRIATPEKALLDFFWWENAQGTESEFFHWGIQDPLHQINHRRLRAFAKQWNQPRLIRAAERLGKYLKSSEALAAQNPTPPPRPMHRETEEKLVDFVARQHRDFDPQEWMEEPHPTGASALERAAVAHFLALTTFGHERPLPSWVKQKEALLEVAIRLAPNNRNLDAKVQATEFQPDRFSNMLNAVVEHQLEPA